MDNKPIYFDGSKTNINNISITEKAEKVVITNEARVNIGKW